MNAIVDLTHFYDFMIQRDVKYFKDFMYDIMPLLEVTRNLFNFIKTKDILVMFYEFYQVSYDYIYAYLNYVN